MDSTGNLAAAARWLRADGRGAIIDFRPTGGGCINQAGVLTLDTGRTLFLKYNPDTPADFFDAEAHGLATLASGGDLRLPAVVHANRNFLLLEDLGRGNPCPDYWQRLGEGLARLHATTGSKFGLERDNYCGSTPQINTQLEDGWEFFARHRLLSLGARTHNMGLLPDEDLARLESLAGNLSNWIPDQPAVLIHGDLWSGNVHCDKEGQPALVDPACYYGWAEAELAMTRLFSGFTADFYLAYEANGRVERDWKSRAGLYNLYHLLNHLLLFGSGYLGQVRQVLAAYV